MKRQKSVSVLPGSTVRSLLVQFFWILSNFYCDKGDAKYEFLWFQDLENLKNRWYIFQTWKQAWWYWQNIEYSTLHNQDNLLMGLKHQSIVKMNSNTWSRLTFFCFVTNNFLAKDLLMALHWVDSKIQFEHSNLFSQSLGDRCLQSSLLHQEGICV